MRVERYTPDKKELWDSFVDESKNGTFLFKRGYMDYHSDRFDDFSLMAYNDKGRLVALLPACKDGDRVYSHRGLTYGGWVMPLKHFDVTDMLAVWDEMAGFLASKGVKHLEYKAIPHIYHRYPSEEDIYALFRNRGQLVASYVSTTIPLGEPMGFNENARRGMKCAMQAGVTVEESDDYAGFWAVLAGLLKERYGTSPVHTLQEMELLHGRFPENIKLYVAKKAGAVIAGTVMYYSGTVAHAQYIAASEEGKRVKALPLLFDYVIRTGCDGFRYFDFGTSNEDGGNYLNEGLVRQKCGMGGRAVAYNIYRVDF